METSARWGVWAKHSSCAANAAGRLWEGAPEDPTKVTLLSTSLLLQAAVTRNDLST